MDSEKEINNSTDFEQQMCPLSKTLKRLLNQNKRQRNWEWELEKIQQQFHNIKPFQSQIVSNNSGKNPEYNNTNPTIIKQPTGANTFKVEFDVKDYDTDAVSVRCEDNVLIIEAKTFISKGFNRTCKKEFYRKVQIPAGFDTNNLVCWFSLAGALTIEVVAPPSYHEVSSTYLLLHKQPPIQEQQLKHINSHSKTLPCNHKHVEKTCTIKVIPTGDTKHTEAPSLKPNKIHTFKTARNLSYIPIKSYQTIHRSNFSNPIRAKHYSAVSSYQPMRKGNHRINPSMRTSNRRRRLMSLSDSAESEAALSSSPSDDLYDVDSWFGDI